MAIVRIFKVYINIYIYVCTIDIYLYIHTHIYICLLGFPHGSAGKESACNAEDLGLIPGLARFPGEGYPLHYSGLENSMDYSPWGRKEST